MKFFSALADAEFAREAFKSAGLDFDALKTTKNTDAIKALKSPANADELKQAEEAIKAAKEENIEISAKLEKAAGFETKFNALKTAVEGVGLKVEDPAKIKADFDAAITKAKREAVATAQGHPGLTEDPKDDPAKQQQVKKPAVDSQGNELKGRDRVVAGLAADPSLRSLIRRRAN